MPNCSLSARRARAFWGGVRGGRGAGEGAGGRGRGACVTLSSRALSRFRHAQYNNVLSYCAYLLPIEYLLSLYCSIV